MKIKSIALGNTEEAYVEERFSDGVNIIFSDDNNKGKTIIFYSLICSIIFNKDFEIKGARKEMCNS